MADILDPIDPSPPEDIRLACIVAIDVVGFSRLSEKDQKRAAQHVQALHLRIERFADANKGRIFNTAGDGFMLEFGSAGAALGFIQEMLDYRPKKREPAFRIGAHVGDVVVSLNNDLLGHGVNVAARLQELATPNSALVSGEFRSMARTSPRVGFRAKGQRPLANIEQKVQTFAIMPRRRGLAPIFLGLGLAVAMAAGLGAAYLALSEYGLVQQVIDFGAPAPAGDGP